MNKHSTEILHRFEAHNPHPRTELFYTNPYTLLVAVVLSAQATDAGVNKATPALFACCSTPQDMCALGEAGLAEAIKTIGLYKTKARHIMALSRMLCDSYCGQVPESRDALEALPGVGRKTANVVLSVAFGQPTIAVDTHVFRVSHRLGLSKGKTPLEVEKDLESLIPENQRAQAHHWLILHGRYICVARKPKCGACFLNDLCPFPEKDMQTSVKG
jgi:endonuclease-3